MTLTRSEVAHMGAVIACEVNALKRYVDKIKNTARRSDEHLEAQIEAIAEALVYTMKRVDRLEAPKGAFTNTVWAPYDAERCM